MGLAVAFLSGFSLLAALVPKVGFTLASAISVCYFSLYLLIDGKH